MRRKWEIVTVCFALLILVIYNKYNRYLGTESIFVIFFAFCDGVFRQ